MSVSENRPWNLQSFLDSLVVELDKAQDTLALKAVNRPLTYTVKDVALDLQIFPAYDGGTVQFTTARPGQSGSSKISLTLGSITDRMIRETAPPPLSGDDVMIDDIKEIDPETKRALTTVGVKSAKDLDRMQRRNISIKAVGGKSLDYGRLADVINRARRGMSPPSVHAVSLSGTPDAAVLRVRGKNLAPIAEAEGFPAAMVNDRRAQVLSTTDEELCVHVTADHLSTRTGELKVALDPYSVLRLMFNSN